MISVRPRANRREDRAGDPLDGLVNLFDLGIVLSVAFLLAALSSLHLGNSLTKHGLRPVNEITVKPGQKVAPLPKRGTQTVGQGTQVGSVYRLSDGELIYVQNTAGKQAPTAGKKHPGKGH